LTGPPNGAATVVLSELQMKRQAAMGVIYVLFFRVHQLIGDWHRSRAEKHYERARCWAARAS